MDQIRTLASEILLDLESRIASGELSDRFPTDRELVEEYGVSRVTVREAVDELRERGLIERYRGRGSFVNAEHVRRPLGILNDLFRAVRDAGLRQEYRVLKLEVVRDSRAARTLGLPARSPLVHLRRLRLVEMRPLSVDFVWLPAAVAGPILEEQFESVALYDALDKRCGVRLTSVEETIEPSGPGDGVREVLAVEGEELVYRVERLGFVDSELVEWREAFIRADEFVLRSLWNRAKVVEPIGFVPRDGTD